MDYSVELVARSGLSADHGGRPPIYKAIGIILAVSSGVFIGMSFVLKKLGLLKANVKYEEEAGEGYGYLKNAWWWSGMTLMIIGEICNFVAYAFVDAILVTPMGALAVVVTAILSAIFLKERLSFVGQVGCFMCIIGSVVIALNSPAQSSAATIQDMQGYVLSPGFLTYAGVIIVGCIIIAVWAGPKYGKKSMLVYLTICSLIGGLSVVATQGLGAAIVTQISGVPQFNQWFLWVLLVFVVTTLITEIIYLNKALNIFNAALVTPTYYVYFTSATIITSAILFRGFKGTPIQIITIIMGFLQICSGVILLQLSKSAKDVPDTAVFKGDFDQVRTIAEQEEHESEPRADVIRGTSGLVRAISRSRLRREADEARRVHEERLEPIGENEVVQWDGIRRRKSSVQSGAPLRSKTMHYPLGLTYFPEESDDEHDTSDDHHQMNIGLFSTIRRKASTAFHHHPKQPRRAHSDRTVSYGSNIGETTMIAKSPVQLQVMSAARMPSTGTVVRSASGGAAFSEEPEEIHQPIQYRLGDNLDTEYKSPRPSTIKWDDESAGVHAREDSLQVPHHHSGNAKRQFSFQQGLFGRGRRASTQTNDSSDLQPPASSGSAGAVRGSFLGFGRKKDIPIGPTEEETLGLVKGDSPSADTPSRTTSGRTADRLSTVAASDIDESEKRLSGSQRRQRYDAFDDRDFDEHFENAADDEDDDWNGHYDTGSKRNSGYSRGRPVSGSFM